MWNADFGIVESLEEMRIVGKLRNAELPLVLSLISSPFRNSATRNLDYFSKSVLCTRVARPERQFRNPPFAISLSSPGASRQKRVESKNYK